jgi:plasmid stability protein
MNRSVLASGNCGIPSPPAGGTGGLPDARDQGIAAVDAVLIASGNLTGDRLADRTGSVTAAPLPGPTVRLLDMRCTCNYLFRMKMIQIRNVPDAIHRTLKARAATEGLSLSDYLMAEIRKVAERPSTAEIRKRLAERSPVPSASSPTEILRAERDGR